jgi:hypothetical protein
VSEPELRDFQITKTLDGSSDWQLLAATDTSGTPIRLTVFSSEISRCADFRRALKMDRAMLLMLQHQSIIRFLGTGESDGTLFFWTATTDYPPLSQQLADGRRFSADDIIEIGWQICSALQQAHNLGLSHGRLHLETVLLSDNLQVLLTGFGVERWLRGVKRAMPASDSGPALITISALASREQVENDLKDLAELLSQLLTNASVEESESASAANPNSSRGLLERLLARCLSDAPGQIPVTAREFQGRLGEILIGSEEDTMPLVDQRDSVTTSRPSIVRELFEPGAAVHNQQMSRETSAGSAVWKQILPILAVLVLAAIITLIAVLAR